MDELKAAAERILIASKDPSAGVWVWGDASFGDCALRCDMEILARHYLSPPVAGPGFDAGEVTQSALSATGFTPYDTQYEGAVDAEGLWLGIGSGLGICWELARGVYLSDENEWNTCIELPHVKTMGDVSRLRTALGIPPAPAPTERNGE